MQKSEEKYHRIFETAQDAYYESSAEGILLDISPSIEILSNGQYTRADLIGKSLLDFYDNSEARAALFSELISKGKVIDYELTLKNKDGSIIPVAISTSLIKDTEGNSVKITGSIRNITNRKIAEDKIRISEAKYRSIFETVQDAYYEASPEGILLDISPSIETLTSGQYTREELIGKSLVNMSADSDARARFYTQLMLQGKVIDYELSLLNKDGSIVPVAISTSLIIDADGNPLKITGSIRDNTERKQAEIALMASEDKYRTLIESQSEGIGLVDENEVFTFVNPAALKIFETDNLIGLSLFDFLTASEILKIHQQTQNRRKGFSNNYDLQILTPKDNVKYLSVSTQPKYDANGKYQGAFGVFSDITERKNAQDALKVSEDKYRKDLQVLNSILESPVNIIVFSLDTNYCYLAFSKYHAQTMKQIWGIDIQVGMNMLDMITNPNERLKSKINFDRTLSGDYFDLIEEYGDVDLYRTYYENFYNPVKNNTGQIIGISVFVLDITERMQSSKRLEISEERFSQVVAQSNEVVWEINADGLYLFLSPIAEDIYGYSPEEMIGKMHFYDLLPEVQSEQIKKRALEFFQKTDNLTNFISIIVRKDGIERIISSNGVRVLNDHGETISFRGVAADITDRVEAEKEITKFHTIADQANYGVVITSIDGTLLYVNNAYARMLGWEVSDLLDTEPTAVHNEEQYPRVKEIIALIMSKRECTAEELYYLRKDDSTFPAEMNAKVIYDEKNVNQYISFTVIDISERKRNEEEFQKIYKAVEQSPVMTVITNLAGHIEYVNPAFTKVTGYTKEELIGQNPRILKSGEKSEEEYKNLYDRLSSGHEWKGEFHNKKKNGEMYWAGALISPIFDSNCKITHYVSVEEDITHQKQIEKELLELNSNLEQKVELRTIELNELNQRLEKELVERFRIEKDLRWNETLLQLMANSSPLGFLIVDNRTDDILYFNDRFCQIWEIEQLADRMYRGELKNNDIIPYCLPVLTDIPAFAESCTPLQDENNRVVVEDEIPFTQNRTVRRFSTQIRGENDEYFGRFYIFEEITERKRAEVELLDSEQRFSLFMDYLPALVFIKDNDSKMIYANNAMETGLGVSEWINKSLFDTFDHETAERILADDKKTLEKGYQIIEESFANLDGKLHDYETQKFAIPQKGKKPLIGAIALDITLRKQAEFKVLQAKEEAEKANLAKSEFLSRMSHELRTPMNSILGFAQLLQMGELNVSQKRGVNHILGSGKYLLNLINDVLDISRIEAGNLAVSIEPVHLKPIYAEMLDVMNPQASKKGVRLNLIDSRANNLYVYCDRHNFKQIMLNLLNNAIKYNKDGGAVSIKTETRLNNDIPFIRISITDTGIGIQPEDIPKLFTPFERIGSEKTLIEGTGLGLAIIKRIMTVMRGTYGVESIPDKGSTFWIELPQAESQHDALDKSQQMKEIVARSSQHSGIILYIEDNVSNIELIEEVLDKKRPGINVITSIYGKETLKLAIEYKPDLILLDLNLPDMDGAEVLKIILGNDKTKDIPVVIISADGMQYQVDKLLKAGAKKYLTKPLDISVFLKIIDEIFTLK